MPRRQAAVEAIGRLVESADFERLLCQPSRARTAHFAVHHAPNAPKPPSAAQRAASDQELSTISAGAGERPVDDLREMGPMKRLGVIVPKRHARRSVTRSLLKRQVHAAGRRHADGLASGLWIVRLRAPFDRAAFPSASSVALRVAARTELDSLFQAVAGSVS